MDFAETPTHGATASPHAAPFGADRGGGGAAASAAADVAAAAARYLDLWELNQAEIARHGPPRRG